MFVSRGYPLFASLVRPGGQQKAKLASNDSSRLEKARTVAENVKMEGRGEVQPRADRRDQTKPSVGGRNDPSWFLAEVSDSQFKFGAAKEEGNTPAPTSTSGIPRKIISMEEERNAWLASQKVTKQNSPQKQATDAANKSGFFDDFSEY